LSILHTRQEIIEMWLEQPSASLDRFVCPSCKDLLYCDAGAYFCKNALCAVDEITLHADGSIVEVSS